MPIALALSLLGRLTLLHSAVRWTAIAVWLASALVLAVSFVPVLLPDEDTCSQFTGSDTRGDLSWSWVPPGQVCTYSASEAARLQQVDGVTPTIAVGSSVFALTTLGLVVVGGLLIVDSLASRRRATSPTARRA